MLITGASGFLGGAVANRVSRDLGYECVLWNRRVHGNLLDSDRVTKTLMRLRPDQIVHLAWLGTATSGYRSDMENWSWAEASWHLAKTGAALGARLVLFGSAREVWPNDGSAYALSKRTLAARLLASDFSSNVTWVRPFWIYDKKLKRPTFLRLFAEGEVPDLSMLSEPWRQLDFLKIQDAVAAIALVLNAKVDGGVVELGSGVLISIESFIGAFYPTLKDRGEASMRENDGEGIRPAATGRLREAGWAPTATMRELNLELLQRKET